MESIETLAPEELTEAVADYELFMKAITEVSPVPIRFDEIEGEAKGKEQTMPDKKESNMSQPVHKPKHKANDMSL